MISLLRLCVFFFNETATPEIYTLSLHDALPIYPARAGGGGGHRRSVQGQDLHHDDLAAAPHPDGGPGQDRKSTRLNSSHANISYAVFCLKKRRPTSTHPDDAA